MYDKPAIISVEIFGECDGFCKFGCYQIQEEEEEDIIWTK
jgi:hypothetical protein